MNEHGLLQRVVEEQPYPLLFATVSGAHLYGFPSPDSDFDLRGVHLLPLEECVGLTTGPQTLTASDTRAGREIDLVTHEVGKFCRLLLKPNGYVLEQLLSPLRVHTSEAHVELCEIAQLCITRQHVRHYLGFARTQWRLVEQERRVKPLLYVYRVLLTGIHLMASGEVEANLMRLSTLYPLPQLPELLEIKRTGSERSDLPEADLRFHAAEYERLATRLEETAATSRLPDRASGAPALHDFLLRLRLSGPSRKENFA